MSQESLSPHTQGRPAGSGQGDWRVAWVGGWGCSVPQLPHRQSSLWQGMPEMTCVQGTGGSLHWVLSPRCGARQVGRGKTLPPLPDPLCGVLPALASGFESQLGGWAGGPHQKSSQKTRGFPFPKTSTSPLGWGPCQAQRYSAPKAFRPRPPFWHCSRGVSARTREVFSSKGPTTMEVEFVVLAASVPQGSTSCPDLLCPPGQDA